MTLFILHLSAVKSERQQCFSMRGMWKNTIGIAIFSLLFYFVQDTLVIRYMIFMALFLIVYFIKGKTIIQEFSGDS